MPLYQDHRSHLNTIIKAALEAADPSRAVKKFLSREDVREAKRVFIVGAGKAGLAMGEAVMEIVGEKFEGGVVSVSSVETLRRSVSAVQTSEVLKTSEVFFVIGGHPKPTEGSIEAGKAIAELLKDTREDDVVIAVISGGGSALMELPGERMTLDDLRELTELMLKSGAPIQEFNCVRKHLSRIKGGGLAKMAYPAKVIALILSDVIGDPLDVIASGPTVGDSTTVEEAKEILRKRNAPKKFEAMLHETLKPNDKVFARVENRLVGTNQLAREAAARAARELGFEAVVSERVIEGEARECAREVIREIKEIGEIKERALIYGGEATVTVKGNGIGGRKQEFVLSAAIEMKGWEKEKILVASFGTDGVDGMTASAGAFATSETMATAVQKKIDPNISLENNDSHTFFKAVDQLIETGATGTNVNDVVIALIYPHKT
ncbi:MAG: glycerate kinase [Chloroflexi bacterium]|nr:glycerate kinase [Chloroflexota bacterium]